MRKFLGVGVERTGTFNISSNDLFLSMGVLCMALLPNHCLESCVDVLQAKALRLCYGAFKTSLV